jgi:xanthine dehydrogenase small subunit
MRNEISFYLNGEKQSVGPSHASMMLAEYLRTKKALTGTKIVCAEGDCGACTVLRYFPLAQDVVHDHHYLPINSCIATLAQLDGSSLITVEALMRDGNLHPSQASMMNCHASQCGFCTPGFVMALTGLVEEKIQKNENSISEQEAKNALTGNLCRCTGYESIIKAATHTTINPKDSLHHRYFNEEQNSDLLKISSTPVHLKNASFEFYAPTSITAALDYLKIHPDAKILGAATDLGVQVNKRKIKFQNLLSLHLVKELYITTIANQQVHIGARVTLSELRHSMKNHLPELTSYLDIFASPQIKNIATLIGNIANASPIGDTPPALLALEANVEIASLNGNKTIPLSEFFVSYRKTKLKVDEIITQLSFRLPSNHFTLKLYKNSNRKDLDISAINLALKVDWIDEKKTAISNITLAAGGIAATPIRLSKTENYLKTHKISKANLDQVLTILHSEFKPLSDVRASKAYRHILVENYFIRALSESGMLQ